MIEAVKAILVTLVPAVKGILIPKPKPGSVSKKYSALFTFAKEPPRDISSL